MTPEQKARQNIDELLIRAGWVLQDVDQINLGAGLGIAVREYPTNKGPVDYGLFVDRKAIGVVEAKATGTTLSGVAEQTEKYIRNFPDDIPHFSLPLPFAYESTGVETFFRDERDPDTRSRRVFAFHKPDTLLEWISEDETLRARLMNLPPLMTQDLRECQIEAVNNLDASFKDAKPRALIQMATGSGKTFTAVTPDVDHKTHFVIVDAVGVTETDKTDSRPLERKKSVSFEKLVQSIAMGKRDEDTLTTLAGRLARLNVQLDEPEQHEISEAANGKTLTEITNGLLDAVDPDKQIKRAKEKFSVDKPSDEQIAKAVEELANEACAVFDDPDFRNTLIAIRKQLYQIIDTVSIDELIDTKFDEKKAKDTVKSFKKFMEANKDEILALQIIYNKPYDQRHLTYAMIKELANAMKKPPYNLSSEIVWMAFEQMGKKKLKKKSPDLILADIISLVRYGLGKDDQLLQFHEVVDKRFNEWLEVQKQTGVSFNDEQVEWLSMIKEHIASSMQITVDDFDNVPFYDKGGVMKVYNLFGDKFNSILDELNEVLSA